MCGPKQFVGAGYVNPKVSSDPLKFRPYVGPGPITNRYTGIALVPDPVDPTNWDVDKVAPLNQTLAGVGFDWRFDGSILKAAATFDNDFLNGPVIVLLTVQINSPTYNMQDKQPWSLTFDSGGWLKNLVEISSNAYFNIERGYFQRYFCALADALPRVTISIDMQTFFTPIIDKPIPVNMNVVVLPNFTKTVPALGDPRPAQPIRTADPQVRRSPRQLPSTALDFDMLEDVDDVKHHHPWRV